MLTLLVVTTVSDPLSQSLDTNLVFAKQGHEYLTVNVPINDCDNEVDNSGQLNPDFGNT